MKRHLLLLSFFCLTAFPSSAAVKPRGQAPNLPFTKQLLPEVLEMVHVTAIAATGERRAPRFAAIALGKDEYIYSILDKTLIRVVKDRFELPPWRICGDWASVRVSLMGESMETLAPESIWFLVYRDGHWTRVFQNEEGTFLRGGLSAQVPPYAVRCFNLDHKDLTD